MVMGSEVEETQGQKEKEEGPWKRPSTPSSSSASLMIPLRLLSKQMLCREKGMYERGFQSIMDGLDDDGDDELCAEQAMGMGGAEKKRRLSVEQVRALEKNFEVENKLEPERKVRLAQELGLQPRQVAVWFQNRRARWKTKQLERDYGALKASYDALRADYDSLHHDKESLLAEIKELKTKLAEEDQSLMSSSSVKKEPAAFEAEHKGVAASPEELPALIYKDGSSVDSDSSAVLNDGAALNDENSPRCPAGGGVSSPTTATAAAAGFGSCSSFPQEDASQFMQDTDSKNFRGGCFYQQPMLKMEEHEFLGDEEPCSRFFSDEQAPTLSWYYPDHWN